MNTDVQERILEEYNKKIGSLESDLQLNKKGSARFSYTRLTIVIFAIPFIYFLSKIGLVALILGLISVIVAFIYAVMQQQLYDEKVKRGETLMAINENEINSILSFRNTYYNGAQFDEAHHLYSDDLDIFGENSVYGLINRAASYDGVHILADYFLTLPSLDELKLRQEAVKELEKSPNWRQEFAASLYNIEGGYARNLAKEIDEELNVDLVFATGGLLNIFRRILPFLWLIIIGLYFINPNIANILVSVLFLGNLLIVIRKTSEVSAVQNHLSQASNLLKSYSEALELIIERDWHAEIIKKEKQDFLGKNQSEQVVAMLSDLGKIIEHLDYRLNLIPAILLNGLVLWDFRVLNRLATWKNEHHGKLKSLFDFIGRIEALSSLATWSYNYPDYTYPEFNEQYFYLKAREAKHPLIPMDESVANDFEISERQHLSIVTGSNMSGKSTLLRTLGVNTILAYTGAKVAAKEFRVSMVQVISYMRIKDILEESVSTFKAELNRISLILRKLDEGEKCFILIDEMLRGTNSKDKLTGSIGIAKRLLNHKTYAMIATHDIKLAELGNEIKEGISNYYFDIDYDDGELVFDYKVKEGICENFNASFLLEQLGIEME